MNIKNRYKVMPLDGWMLWMEPEELLEDMGKYAQKIEPIFNRNGQYYDRMTGQWWFEVDGHAFTDVRPTHGYQILWVIKSFSHKILSSADKKNIMAVADRIVDKSLVRKLREAIRNSEDAEQVNRMGDSTLDRRLHEFKFNKRFREEYGND